MVALVVATLLTGGSLVLSVMSTGSTVDRSTAAGGPGSHSAGGTLGQREASARTGGGQSHQGSAAAGGATPSHRMYFPLLVNSPDH